MLIIGILIRNHLIVRIGPYIKVLHSILLKSVQVFWKIFYKYLNDTGVGLA